MYAYVFVCMYVYWYYLFMSSLRRPQVNIVICIALIKQLATAAGKCVKRAAQQLTVFVCCLMKTFLFLIQFPFFMAFLSFSNATKHLPSRNFQFSLLFFIVVVVSLSQNEIHVCIIST